MKKYVDGERLKNVLGKLKGQLDKKQDVLPYYSNPNLLDNWYFVNPVNQRGQTEYQIDGYSIDRWIASCIATLENDGISLLSDGVNSYFGQRLSRSTIDAIKGRTVTMSWLLDIGLFSKTDVIPESGNFDLNDKEIGVSDWRFDMFTVSNQDTVSFRIYNSSKGGDSITVIAAKLELGDHQTLAHREGDKWVLNDPPPNYQQELAKCQRYQMVISSSNSNFAPVGIGQASMTSRVKLIIPTPVSMRVNPTCTFSGVKLRNSETYLDLNSIETIHLAPNCLLMEALVENAIVGAAYDCYVDQNGQIIFDANL